MRSLALSLSVCAAFAGSGTAAAQTPTTLFLADCRALVYGAGGGAENCRAMLEGALGAFGLITKEFYPISAQLGYCVLPGTTPEQAAEVIVNFADANPECRDLAHFSMCMNMAFQSAYAESC